jgi:hypothetical protein
MYSTKYLISFFPQFSILHFYNNCLCLIIWSDVVKLFGIILSPSFLWYCDLLYTFLSKKMKPRSSLSRNVFWFPFTILCNLHWKRLYLSSFRLMWLKYWSFLVLIILRLSYSFDTFPKDFSIGYMLCLLWYCDLLYTLLSKKIRPRSSFGTNVFGFLLLFSEICVEKDCICLHFAWCGLNIEAFLFW